MSVVARLVVLAALAPWPGGDLPTSGSPEGLRSPVFRSVEHPVTVIP